MTDVVQRHLDAIVRESYGRLLAILASRCRDVESAEDALADAIEQALESWPHTMPSNPAAWLLTAARRRLVDGIRHHRRLDVRPINEYELWELDAEPDAIPDERLRLMFVCAHPSIAPSMRTALMLQCVLGVSADRIASAMLVAPATMGQRLVRAKAKIRDAGLPFDVPGPPSLEQRLGYVLDAIYAAYTTGTDALPGDADGAELESEARHLARVLADLLPGHAEVWGLLSVLLATSGRAPARFDDHGCFVPLNKQDTGRWHTGLLDEAERALQTAAGLPGLGRYCVEASIHSAHSARRFGHDVPWTLICTMYDHLVLLTPSVGARIARCSARAELIGRQQAHAELCAMESSALADHQPYWVARYILGRGLATNEYSQREHIKAFGLTRHPGIRQYLQTL